jgi:hypothetical protein
MLTITLTSNVVGAVDVTVPLPVPYWDDHTQILGVWRSSSQIMGRPLTGFFRTIHQVSQTRYLGVRDDYPGGVSYEGWLAWRTRTDISNYSEFFESPDVDQPFFTLGDFDPNQMAPTAAYSGTGSVWVYLTGHVGQTIDVNWQSRPA